MSDLLITNQVQVHFCVSIVFYTPEVKLRTYYGMAFVRLSVCPSVSHIMSAQYLETFMSDSHGTWYEDWSWSVDDPYKF